MIFQGVRDDQEIKGFLLPFINIFSMECTDCLKVEFFKLLKKLIIDVKGKKGKSELFIQGLLIHNFHHHLLSASTQSNHIKSFCVKFLNFLLRKYLDIKTLIIQHKTNRKKQT